jgi:hypothetical protein
MKGVEYFYDEQGEPKAVLIDLRINGDLWEDFQDLLMAEKRRSEPCSSLDDVKAALQKKRTSGVKK